MKIRWKIKMLDGSVRTVDTVENSVPALRDGKFIDEIPIEVSSKVTTPTSFEITGIDVVIAATELNRLD